MKTINLAIAGLGTVAQGLLQLLQENRSQILQQTGCELNVKRVASRTPREVDLLGASFSQSVSSLIEHNDVDLLVELIGGEDTALDLVRQALTNSLSVVTANKAIIASHGDELFSLAQSSKTRIEYEAAVAGGIPIVGVLRHALVANEVRRVVGIINGTTNYMLSQMTENGAEQAEALADAQRLGYAEADPTFDVGGIDAGHKLTILAHLAFGIPLDTSRVAIEGIESVTAEDIQYARELGYVIKHLGVARNTDVGLEIGVHPALLRKDDALAQVNGVTNAVLVEDLAVGDSLYCGPGAGARPTASSVLADILAVALGTQRPPSKVNNEVQFAPLDCVVSASYLYIPALNKPGVFAKVATILSDLSISIEAAIQHPSREGSAPVPVVVLTQAVTEAKTRSAMTALESLPEVTASVRRIRVL